MTCMRFYVKTDWFRAGVEETDFMYFLNVQDSFIFSKWASSTTVVIPSYIDKV